MPAPFPVRRTGCEARAPSEPPPGSVRSQPAALETVHTSVPKPALVMLTADGEEVPASDETVNDSVRGLRPIFGCEFTFRVTVTLAGELVAPVAAKVMAPT